MKATLENGKLTIVLDANTSHPPVSSSGKTRLVASDRDKGSLQVDGKPLTIQVNAYVKN